MSKTPAKSERPSFADADIAKARQWFAKGQELAEKKNYDYAIESYISGLEFWPDAVEEGHKPCRAASLFRGPQKIGLMDQMKYKTNLKDLKKSMLNAELLLSKDARNIGYMETMLRCAAKSRFDQTALWVGEILADAASKEEKFNPARWQLLREVFEELGELNQESDPVYAIQAFERAVAAQTRLRNAKPSDMGISTDLRDLAGKLTILKGKYSTAESFKESVHDSQTQRELHDKDRIVQSDVRMDELLAAARSRYEAAPTDSHAVNDYVDLLCRREDDAEERTAMKVLMAAHEATGEYRYKMRAEDIRLRQLRRKGREIKASGRADDYRQHLRDQLRFELKIYRERCKQYPTDMSLKFKYGRSLFDARLFDEAIPVLQEARNDPKTRHQCGLYVGRCFYEKQYYDQAADVFRETIENYEVPDDELGKELHYWLGRSHEAGGRREDALKIYGQLIKWDYNYRKGDVRQRIDGLRKEGGPT